MHVRLFPIIDYEICTSLDKAFIFGMCVPYDKAFPIVTFLSYEIKLSYLACLFLMTRPFQWYHKFSAYDLARDL